MGMSEEMMALNQLAESSSDHAKARTPAPSGGGMLAAVGLAAPSLSEAVDLVRHLNRPNDRARAELDKLGIQAYDPEDLLTMRVELIRPPSMQRSALELAGTAPDSVSHLTHFHKDTK